MTFKIQTLFWNFFLSKWYRLSSIFFQRSVHFHVDISRSSMIWKHLGLCGSLYSRSNAPHWLLTFVRVITNYHEWSEFGPLFNTSEAIYCALVNVYDRYKLSSDKYDESWQHGVVADQGRICGCKKQYVYQKIVLQRVNPRYRWMVNKEYERVLYSYTDRANLQSGGCYILSIMSLLLKM